MNFNFIALKLDLNKVFLKRKLEWLPVGAAERRQEEGEAWELAMFFLELNDGYTGVLTL